MVTERGNFQEGQASLALDLAFLSQAELYFRVIRLFSISPALTFQWRRESTIKSKLRLLWIPKAQGSLGN